MESNKYSMKPVVKHTKKRHHHHHHHRRTKKISQKIELKKQNFQCVINLNTTICEHEANRSKLNTTICECMSHQSNRESHQVSSLIREPFILKTQCYSRIAPYCFREKCRGVVKQCRCREIRERRDHVRDKMAKHHPRTRRNFRQDSKQIRLPDRHRKHKNDSLKLSPISSPLKDDLNHLYEDISNESLDEVLETPMSYKNVKYVENKVESKLDSLIKRTKERERKQVAQSRSRPSFSIGSASNISSGECPMDLGTLDSVSLHSQSTLVLEKNQCNFIYLSSDNEEYSPRSPSDFIVNIPRKYELEHGKQFSPGSPMKHDFNMNISLKYEHDQTYSPLSPLQSDFIMNVPKKYKQTKQDFKIDNIKTEPIDTGIYSPTFNSSKEEIKKKIKIKSESFENDIKMIHFDIKKEVE